MQFSPNQLTAIVGAWSAAGLPAEPIEGIAGAAAARLAALNAEYGPLRRESQRDPRLVARIASGEIGLHEAVLEEHERALAGRDQQARLGEIHRAAVEAICNGAHRQLCALGDRLLTEHIAPAFDALVATVTKHAPAVSDITDDAGAVRAGGKAREAWGALADAVEQRERLTRALRALGSADVLSSLPDSIDSAYRSYGRPDLRPRSLPKMHPVVALVALVESGMEPGIFTSAQASENATTVAKMQRERVPA